MGGWNVSELLRYGPHNSRADNLQYLLACSKPIKRRYMVWLLTSWRKHIRSMGGIKINLLSWLFMSIHVSVLLFCTLWYPIQLNHSSISLLDQRDPVASLLFARIISNGSCSPRALLLEPFNILEGISTSFLQGLLCLLLWKFLYWIRSLQYCQNYPQGDQTACNTIHKDTESVNPLSLALRSLA